MSKIKDKIIEAAEVFKELKQETDLQSDVQEALHNTHDEEEFEEYWKNEKYCGRCYESVEELYAPKCAEKPELLVNVPLGQYHCPDCGAMVVAGVPHLDVCARCRDLEHPQYDKERS